MGNQAVRSPSRSSRRRPINARGKPLGIGAFSWSCTRATKKPWLRMGGLSQG